jgi:uncharacterized protein YndB with AHSA1/START domain
MRTSEARSGVWSLVSAPGFWGADPEGVKGTTAVAGESTVARNPEFGEFPVRVVKVEPPSYVAYRWAPASPGQDLPQVLEAAKKRVEQSTV